jgi:hypothetical protein
MKLTIAILFTLTAFSLAAPTPKIDQTSDQLPLLEVAKRDPEPKAKAAPGRSKYGCY